MATPEVDLVGFLGFDDLSLELSASLLRSGYSVKAFDIVGTLTEELSRLGGVICDSPVEAAKDVAALIVIISHPDQINDIIFRQEDATKGLKKGAVVLLRSAIPASDIQNLEKHFAEDGREAYLVDTYISRGVSGTLNGKFTIIASGRFDAITRARPILSAMSEKLYVYEGEVGIGRKVEMVNELLQGIHLVASVEAISLGAQSGIHRFIIHDIISNAAGNSWIFKNHVPLLLKGHYTTLSLYQNLFISCCTSTTYKPESLAAEITAASTPVSKVGFIGLGAMGFGMAQLLQSFSVIGFDAYKPMLVKFASAGGLVANSPV